jgi:menaquinone-dependent protoporphyrinogen oxidase
MKWLIVYGTDQGQSAKIAGRIKQVLRNHGDSVEMFDGRSISADTTLARYEAVIIGASVHSSQFQPYMRRFVKKHRAELQRIPAAFFSVSLLEAHPDPTQHARLMPVINGFLSETGWQPDKIASFAGAIPRAHSGSWFTRRLVWRGFKRDGAATNTSTYEYTDWDAVARFANKFALQAHTAQVAPAAS